MNDSRQRATEFRNPATHAASAAAVRPEKEDHLSGHEHSRQALEHSTHVFEHAQQTHQQANGNHQIEESAIAARAHELWESRGRPHGSPEQDWYRAAEELRMGK